MPAYHYNKLTLNGAQNYFSQLNPIAEKIARDIEDTKIIYGQIWSTLKYHQKENIINETLIKPEITIQYYDKSTPSMNLYKPLSKDINSSGSTSIDSLTTLVFKNFETSLQFKQENSKNIPVKEQGLGQDSGSGYDYDTHNLSTYIEQKVASKIVHDDAFGAYRDEHSAPFSYRTRSQINLVIFPSEAEITQTENSNAKESAHLKNQIAQCKHNETKLNGRLNNEQTSSSQFTLEDNRIKSNLIGSTLPDRCVVETMDTNINVKKTSHKVSNPYKNPKQLSANNYEIFSDQCNDEHLNLIHSFGCKSFLSNSSHSVASTDIDDDFEDKTLCLEKVKLLCTENDIRKGFDFLNNW